MLAYWNKGSSYLINKQLDIASVIARYKPDILGLGEANFKQGHDVIETKQEGYNLHIGPGLESFGTARVAVYIKEDLIVKRRRDLEGHNVCTIWLQVGMPNQPATLLMFGYRQWQLPDQNNSSSSQYVVFAHWMLCCPVGYVERGGPYLP